eukprot:3063448-Amphidinium_carterae.1
MSCAGLFPSAGVECFALLVAGSPHNHSGVFEMLRDIFKRFAIPKVCQSALQSLWPAKPHACHSQNCQ